MKRPNFLWITLEDCSPRLGCYGDQVARSPHIDGLAAQGTLFTNAFCTAPVCSPSRTSVITGVSSTAMMAQHMRTTYIAEEFPGLPTPYHAVPPPHVKCITEYLRTAGYYCTNNGKTDYQFESPFCAWDANGKPRTVDEIHWRNRRDASQPFFAVFNLEDTHESRMWPDSSPQFEKDGRPTPRTDPARVVVPPFLPDTPEVRTALARHYDSIAHNDTIVGKLLAQLELDGLVDNTVVMIWADHGEGLPRAKRYLYDSGTRVPLIVRWPGRFAAGAVDRRMVSLLDLAPTVLAAAGVPCPVHCEGHSLLEPEVRTHVFAHRDRMDGEYDKARSVRSARFKYIRNYYPGQERFGYTPYRGKHPAMQAIRVEQVRGNASFAEPCPPEEFYDVEADPFEMNNLAGAAELAAVKNELRAVLKGWQRDYDPDRDLGEAQMVAGLWPAGVRPVTEAPIAVVYSEANSAGVWVKEECEVAGPAVLQLACASEGASIAFQREGESGWSIYQGLVRLPAGEHRLMLRAVRYGYAHSADRMVTVRVR
ncbi:MAG: sulfatase [Opitutaceae bacterium]|nr:sulfatase [Opitutaceae bacterium]